MALHPVAGPWGAPRPGTHAGSPYDWDLEAARGAAPTKNGFTPFWVSGGVLQGPIAAAAAADKGVGPQRHSCWTYWGHSGCPLVGADGAVLALHNSWDDSNGQRHGVPLAAMRAFVAAAAAAAAPASAEPAKARRGATAAALQVELPVGRASSSEADLDADELPPLAARLAARKAASGGSPRPRRSPSWGESEAPIPPV